MPPGRSPFSLLSFALTASSLAACFTATEAGVDPGGPGGVGDAGGTGSELDSGRSATDASTGADAGGGGGGEQTSDLPCAVAALLATNCQSCHGATPTMGAPMSLVTHADLAAPSPSKPSITVAASAMTRIAATDYSIMPPSPNAPLSSGDVATFDAWVSSGFPATGCTTGTGGDAGGDAGGTGDDGGSPAVVCTSGVTWTQGDHGSAVMHPGDACISCHSVEDGPTFAAAGTVFPTLHEPDDCDGANLSGLAVIDIIDSNGVETKIPVDTVGNFHAYAEQVTITPPFSAAVVQGSKKRAMTEHQTSGDCNSCHTVEGANGAPGRIMAP
jgi:mono/diheme cytochrome c family protein